MSRRRRRTRSRIPENLNNETINQETAQNSKFFVKRILLFFI